jgi:hypothetical protein
MAGGSVCDGSREWGHLFGAGHLSSWSRFFTAERGLAVMRSRVGPEHLPSGRPGGSSRGTMQYASILIDPA